VALKVHIVASGGKSLNCVVVNCKPNGRVCAEEYKSFENTRCVSRVKKKVMI